MYTIYHISYHIYHDEGVAAPEVSMPVINRTGCASRLQSIPESQEEEKSEINSIKTLQKWHILPHVTQHCLVILIVRVCLSHLSELSTFVNICHR